MTKQKKALRKAFLITRHLIWLLNNSKKKGEESNG
jgi:hypothetical protein